MRASLWIIFSVFLALGVNLALNSSTPTSVTDFTKVTITIDDEEITLGENGTTYFGNDAIGDLNSDGIPDRGFILTREGGGSGAFFYAAAAIQDNEGNYTGTNAVFLGDRIAPQSSEIRNSIFIINYADRGKLDPMTTPPYVGVTAYAYYENDTLGVEWPISLFFYNPALDTDTSGNILCSEQGLVPVSRLIPNASLEDVIRMLIAGKLMEEERTKGITTEFPLSGLSLEKAEKTDNNVTLTFSDPEGKTSGGSCRVNILRAQIEKTAAHFSGKETVRIMPEELFQP